MYELAEVVLNYSRAGIPLETMWTDIDYMDRRRTFTLDPDRFPLEEMREFVGYLHNHDQVRAVDTFALHDESDNDFSNI